MRLLFSLNHDKFREPEKTGETAGRSGDSRRAGYYYASVQLNELCYRERERGIIINADNNHTLHAVWPACDWRRPPTKLSPLVRLNHSSRLRAQIGPHLISIWFGKTFLVFNKNMYARAQCVCTRGSSSVPKGWWWEKCAEERKEKDQHANVRSDKRRRQSNRLELQVLFPSNNISMEQVYNWRPRTKRKILLL